MQLSLCAFLCDYSLQFEMVTVMSISGMTVALVMISATFLGGGGASGVAVVGLALYMTFFSLGMGPGAWLVPSEIFASSIRAKAMSVATFFNRITATLMASTFLSTANKLGWGGFFLLLAAVCVIVAAFMYFYLPETKGRSLEEMTIYFAEIMNDREVLSRIKQDDVEMTTTEAVVT